MKKGDWIRVIMILVVLIMFGYYSLFTGNSNLQANLNGEMKVIGRWKVDRAEGTIKENLEIFRQQGAYWLLVFKAPDFHPKVIRLERKAGGYVMGKYMNGQYVEKIIRENFGFLKVEDNGNLAEYQGGEKRYEAVRVSEWEEPWRWPE